PAPQARGRRRAPGDLDGARARLRLRRPRGSPGRGRAVTLRWRLSLALAAAVSVGALVFGLAARTTVEQVLHADVDRELRGEVDRLVRTPFGPRRPFGRPPGRGGPFEGRRAGAVFSRAS